MFHEMFKAIFYIHKNDVWFFNLFRLQRTQVDVIILVAFFIYHVYV